MDFSDWRSFLTEFSQELLADEEIATRVPPEVRATAWLGFPGATQAEINDLEARLGVRLPPSYRTFLAVSNGWRMTGSFIPRLWPAAELAWFRDRHQSWIDAWNNPRPGRHRQAPPVSDAEYFVYGEEQDTISLRPEYLRTALEISERGDEEILLLNPRIVFEDGEWEAWFFANWLPGAARHRSFAELMRHELEKLRRRNAYKRLSDQDKREYDAGTMLRAALKHLDKGDCVRGRRLLRMVFERYTGTRAADEARARLGDLEGAHDPT
jgi:hypothetical protein